MGANGNYYDGEDYTQWKRNQGKANKIVPRENLLAAVNYIRKFFDARKTNWAALGSLAMLSLGSRRDIPDIHIVYDDKDFQRIKMKLETDPRVRLPKGMNALFASKLLVSTGPRFTDSGCTENADVEVEMIPPGSHGSPPSDVLRSNQVALNITLDGKATSIKGLNMLYLIKTTFHLCSNQDLLWDPRKDLLFLCRKYGKEVEAIRRQLNPRQVQESFLGTPFFSTLPMEEQRLCYHVLLGKDPPPSMFLTPPAGSQEQPTSNGSRPPMPSHKSAPSLKIDMQQGTAFLKPPSPLTKLKTAPGTTTTQTNSHVGAHPPANGVTSEAPRDSRSRYRASSAPNTPSEGRKVSPKVDINTARSDSANAEHSQQRIRVYQAQSINLHNVAHSSKPQVVSHSPTRVNVKQTDVRSHKHWPLTDGAPTNAVPVFAHNSKASVPALKGSPDSSSVDVSAKSRPTTSSENALHKAQTKHDGFTSKPGDQPQVVGYTHPAHKIIAYRTSMLPTGQNTAATALILPTENSTKDETCANGLTIVGSGGLHPKQSKPITQPAKIHPVVRGGQHPTQNASSASVFELDATSPQVATAPQAIPTNEFIAELPPDSITIQPSEPMNHECQNLPKTPVSPPQEPRNSTSMPAYRDSSVSPPVAYRPVTAAIQPLSPEPTAQLPKPAAAPSSFESLPSSLTIGFRGAQRHPTESTASRPSASSQPTSSPATMTKYHLYDSPPSSAASSREPSPNNGPISALDSRQRSPKQDPAPAYKAYSLPMTPPMQPATAPAKPQQPLPAIRNQAPLSPAQEPNPTHSAPIPSGRASPPNILKAGVKPPSFHPPNPLGADPPTPRIPHTKHDSHQGPQNDFIIYTAPTFRQDNTTTHQPHYIPFSTSHHAQPQQPQHTSLPHRQNSNHQRTTSQESTSSTASHDSAKLAQEYQMDLPSYGEGYGAKDRQGGNWYRLDLDLEGPGFGTGRIGGEGGFMDGVGFGRG